MQLLFMIPRRFPFLHVLRFHRSPAAIFFFGTVSGALPPGCHRILPRSGKIQDFTSTGFLPLHRLRAQVAAVPRERLPDAAGEPSASACG